MSNKPTQKQVKFAEDIADRLMMDLPKQYTKEDYSAYITKWEEEYWLLCGYGEDVDWDDGRSSNGL